MPSYRAITNLYLQSAMSVLPSCLPLTSSISKSKMDGANTDISGLSQTLEEENFFIFILVLFLLLTNCNYYSLHSARLNIERCDLDRNLSEAQKLSDMLCIFLLDK